MIDPNVTLVQIEVHEKKLLPTWIQADEPLRMYLPNTALRTCKQGTGLINAKPIGKQESVILLDKTGWHIEPKHVIIYHQEERYLLDSAPTLLSKLPLPYTKVPISIRNSLFGKLAKKNFTKHEHDSKYFPNWPAEKSIEWLRWVSTKLQPALAPKPWPNKTKAVLCLTHDVETREGFSRIKAMRLAEKELSLVSAWGIIAKGYPLDHYLLDSLVKEHCEIIVHGLVHDGKLPFLAIAQMKKQLQDAKKILTAWKPQGFRSPQLQRQQNMYSVIAETYAYDLSQTDTEDLPLVRPNSGCMTVFPFFRGTLVEIPLTLPHDFYMKYGLGYSPRQMKKVWLEKAKLIYDIGGLMLFNLHPDSYLSGSPIMIAIYRDILKEITSWPGVTCMLPKDIATWIRA